MVFYAMQFTNFYIFDLRKITLSGMPDAKVEAATKVSVTSATRNTHTSSGIRRISTASTASIRPIRPFTSHTRHAPKQHTTLLKHGVRACDP